KVVYARRLFQLTEPVPASMTFSLIYTDTNGASVGSSEIPEMSAALASAEKIHILAFGDLFPTEESGSSNTMWFTLFSKISQGKKVKVLLPDPRFVLVQ